MTTESLGRPQTRVDPAAAWNVLTDAPLKGLALAREAGLILAWDERNQLYLLDLRGEHRSVAHAPDRVVAGAISDDGAVIALLGERSRLWVYGPDFDAIADRQGPPDSTALAVDSHGRFIAVSSRVSLTQLYTRHGKPAGRLETRQALAHVTFVPAQPMLIGSAAYGMLIGVEVHPGTSPGRLRAEAVWEEALMSNVGRVATTGDGGMILVSCFTHGVQRYDLRGQNEGSYHLGGTAAFAVVDFAGRTIAVATLEGELIVLSSSGTVRWRTALPRPAIALEVDPLGRYLIYGHATGEIARLDLYGGDRQPDHPSPRIAQSARGPSAVIRKPDWMKPVAASDDQAETAVLTVLDDPPQIGVFTNTNRLQLFSVDGRSLGQGPDLLGIGRILRTAPGWIAAATDRYIVLYDARRKTAQRLDLDLVEVTHLLIRPDTYGLAIVQERDRVGRATPAGRWIWKCELASPVEDLAIGVDGLTAVSTNDGRLSIFDAAGQLAAEIAGDPSNPLCVIEAPDRSPPSVSWLSLARRAQVLRGHDRTGRVLWESPVPWEGWHFLRVGAMAVISAPDGAALSFDGSGHLRGQGKATDLSGEVYVGTHRGEAWRVARQGVHLICSDFAARVKWRAVAEEPLGPLAAGESGVAVMIGRALAWFSNGDS